MESFHSKKYAISLAPYEGTDNKGWTFETEKRVLGFLEQTDHPTLLKLCDRFKLRFFNKNHEDDTETTDDESIIFALLADCKPQDLLKAVEEYEK